MTCHLLIEVDVEGQMARFVTKLGECAMDYCISSIRHRPQIVVAASICGTHTYVLIAQLSTLTKLSLGLFVF